MPGRGECEVPDEGKLRSVVPGSKFKEGEILEHHDDVNAFIYDLDDQQVEWTQAVQRIDDRVIKRAIEIGITGENYKKFDFEEFEIKDMY